MNLDKMVAEAKERLHRSIGQRARWASHDFRAALRDFGVERQRAIPYPEHWPFPTGAITGR